MPTVYIDAGIHRIRVRVADEARDGSTIVDLPACSDPMASAALKGDERVVLTGRLASTVRAQLGRGEVVPAAAAYWVGLTSRARSAGEALALVDLSASGYLVLASDKDGRLRDGAPWMNSRCGAGTGANLDRVLQKLGVRHDEVDTLLAGWLGDAGAERRRALSPRADRCGVFSASATVSDKNQGIPLDHALATTLKSEALKPCRRLPDDPGLVYLTGGVFRWQFARDCASDELRARGATGIHHDAEGAVLWDGLRALAAEAAGVSPQAPVMPAVRPGFDEVRKRLQQDLLYRRLPTLMTDAQAGWGEALDLALDVGSTMAKALIAGADSGEVLALRSYSNAGDTIMTVKAVLRDLKALAGNTPRLRRIAITGSARYQVQQSLLHVYPQLDGRISTLVENYAHARGSIAQARDYLRSLRAAGIADVNERQFVLIDIGGEDTKVSTVSLEAGDLHDNAMNVKCSAGTGSLMDTLAAFFGIESAAEAYARAQAAPAAYELTATCAVFLMESARRLQAQGGDADGILASACWAIVENMARTLWAQIELPGRSVVLLHGQTMLSEPLPLAVAERLQSFVGVPMYCLVPPSPGHRACYGLLAPDGGAVPEGDVTLALDAYLGRNYERRLVRCEGAVCGDPEALCHRASLRDGSLRFLLGGCTAVNERLSDRREHAAAGRRVDSYRALWNAANASLQRSEDPARLVIPRQFAVSEWSGVLAAVFSRFGIAVHVDNVRPEDVAEGQPHFQVDTCAPHLGAVGQMLRLAGAPHGMILAPQIEFLPLRGDSLGRTCTVNQGGPATARALALRARPEARIHLFHLSLRGLDPAALGWQLHRRCREVFRAYGLDPQLGEVVEAVRQALAAHAAQRAQLADLAAEYLEAAFRDGAAVGLVLGREYILSPGLYDSHVGRLLADKGIVAIPGWVLDVETDPELSHIYWRNPHVSATLVRAVAEGRLHQRVRQPRLARAIAEVEARDGAPMALVFVSTFQCGPDSVILPLLAELARGRPLLTLQSDAIIKELAHLENRVGTHVRQLQARARSGQPPGQGLPDAERWSLEQFVLEGGVDRERDLLCLPTMSDNRFVTSVLEGAGFACLDTYAEDQDGLVARIARGRAEAGEAVCAPLAAVHGDTLRALERFRQISAREPNGARRRLVMINSKGSGPCRQGQYMDVHSLLHGQRARRVGAQDGAEFSFLAALEKSDFDVGLGRGLVGLALQGVVLQGVMHQLWFDAAQRCRQQQDFDRLEQDYRDTKQALFALQRCFRLEQGTGRLGNALRLLGQRRRLKRVLRAFSDRWLCRPAVAAEPVQVHVSGETYMRVAQVEALFLALREMLGEGRLALSYTPLWSYFDYKLASRLMRSRDTAADLHHESRHVDDPGRSKKLRRLRNRRLRRWLGVRVQYALLRDYLAAPLYRAARVSMPSPLTHALALGRAVVPTQRPGGELLPYAGEAIEKLGSGVDLVLNVAPEGCMVSTMGDVLNPVLAGVARGEGGIFPLFSGAGEVDREALAQALLRAVGPQRASGVAVEAAG